MIFNNAPSVDIKDILESSEHGIGTFGTNLFISQMPESPDECVCIYDTGAWRESETGFSCQYPLVMIHVRGPRGNYQTGYNTALSIYEALHGLKQEIWNETLYVFIIAQQMPFFLGYDENNRPIFSINFRINRS